MPVFRGAGFDGGMSEVIAARAQRRGRSPDPFEWILFGVVVVLLSIAAIAMAL